MPSKREPEAISTLPLGKTEGETVVSNGCQSDQSQDPDHRVPHYLRESHILLPRLPIPCPSGNNVAVC